MGLLPLFIIFSLKRKKVGWGVILRADREKKSLEIIRQVGFFTIIPMVLLAGPIIGFIIGDYLDKRWDTSPWFMLFFILLGCIASIREMIDLIKKAKR